jgi:hypothetical protein
MCSTLHTARVVPVLLWLRAVITELVKVLILFSRVHYFTKIPVVSAIVIVLRFRGFTLRTVRGGCCDVARVAGQDTLHRYVYALLVTYGNSMYHYTMPADQHASRE